MSKFKERLKIARQARGLNQAQLAELLGVEPSAITRWEKGGGFEESRIFKIAEVLGRTPEWLLGEENEDLGAITRRLAFLESKLSEPEEKQITPEEMELLTVYRQRKKPSEVFSKLDAKLFRDLIVAFAPLSMEDKESFLYRLQRNVGGKVPPAPKRPKPGGTDHN